MTWRLFGRPTRNPLAIAVVVVMCLLLIPPTLVPHLVARLLGGSGFMRGNAYEPGQPWTLMSNLIAYGLLGLVIL